jgi:SagB-type dehydrogenase family enzyme
MSNFSLRNQVRASFDREDELWELFHENSKASLYDGAPATEQVLAWMNEIQQSLPFDGYPAIILPASRAPLEMSLGDALAKRVTARSLKTCALTLEELAAFLYYAYGITRDNQNTEFPRPFRATPSAGALYPLEIFLHAGHIEGLAAGIYHYNPMENALRRLRTGDKTPEIARALVQKEIATGASVLFFITGVFERTTFKYGNRGYRFVMIEAGHVAQNINLVATSLGLGCMLIGGFYDRQIDAVLGIDGIGHSTIYMAAVGIGSQLSEPPAVAGG